MRPFSLPQLNTVCQYLGHQRLMVEIRHASVRAHKHTVFKHKKVLTPNSNLTLQPITTLTVTKSQNGEKRSYRGGGGVARHGGGRDGCLNRLIAATECLPPRCVCQLHKRDKNSHSSNTSTSQARFKKRSLTPNISTGLFL